MKNIIYINPLHSIGSIDRNVFGGFAEHLGRCIYGGMYEPGSPLADKSGFRKDVLEALRRLKMPVIRYPGGNFTSGYRWMDGIGPQSERPTRLDLAWQGVETNQFGTDEFVQFCRQVGAEPYLAVNCGDGDMREARDWVEYCNGTNDTTLVRMRRKNGYDAPHKVKYWGIGNEVDGPWQIGTKTPEEYARAFTEFGKGMKWVDPQICLLASLTSSWNSDFVERSQLLLEQAGDLVDYLAIHWYLENRRDDFTGFMALSELVEERLSAIEGLVRAVSLAQHLKRKIAIAVDEWNVWYRSKPEAGNEEIYNLEDALMTAIQLNAFIRHSATVRMANLAQIVNVIAPILTRPDGLVLQTIFYPFELFSNNCGDSSLDVYWEGETFSGGGYNGVRTLDVSATVFSKKKGLSLFVVNRSADHPVETEIKLIAGSFSGLAKISVINGRDIKSENTFESPDEVITQESRLPVEGQSIQMAFEPHSVTCIVFGIT
jgi:alpha-N-arabinofuranosidase